MSDIRDMLLQTADRIFAQHHGVAQTEALAEGEFPIALWTELEQAGLTGMSVVNEGLNLGDVMAIAQRGGYFAAPVPLIDTLLAQWLLAEIGSEPAEGVLAVGPIFPTDILSISSEGEDFFLSGKLRAVPFGRFCSELIALAETDDGLVLARVPLRDVERSDRCNIADEPRDTYEFKSFRLAQDLVLSCPRGVTRDVLLRRGALLRSAAMAGAIARVLDLSVEYVKERVQFGRPLAKFQAVQQMMAQLAGASAAATAAAEAATAGVEKGNGAFEVAAAKARIGEAATLAAQIAHQVHGAMGFTREHELHLVTRLLWVWREEYGSEAYWNMRLGRAAAKLGGKALWASIVEPGDIDLALPNWSQRNS